MDTSMSLTEDGT